MPDTSEIKVDKVLDDLKDLIDYYYEQSGDDVSQKDIRLFNQVAILGGSPRRLRTHLGEYRV